MLCVVQQKKLYLPVCCDTVLHSSAAALASTVSSPPATDGKSKQKCHQCPNPYITTLTVPQAAHLISVVLSDQGETAAFIVSTCRGQQDLQHVRHGDQMQDVHVIVGGADGRWLQVHGLLLVQRGNRQHQPDLKKYTGTVSPKARNLFD